ncbi:hypothetical protein [Raoultibacter timonensis]|uniref:hypothetical protein n=1 Tax=Raoultibacter timonensis TaxID=1907662 RepID=UPI0026DDAE4B|nr:hypothetical protein [Raoultibacter timonensis]
MSKKDVVETNASFERVRRISGLIRIFLIAVAFVLGILLAVKLWGAVSSVSVAANYLQILSIAASDALIIACVLIGSSVFATLDRGVDPFSKRQSRRLRAISILLLADLAIGVVGSVGAPWLSQYDMVTVGMSASPAAETILNVNAGDLIVAGILLGLSVVFDYARIIQDLSEGTL